MQVNNVSSEVSPLAMTSRDRLNASAGKPFVNEISSLGSSVYPRRPDLAVVNANP